MIRLEHLKWLILIAPLGPWQALKSCRILRVFYLFGDILKWIFFGGELKGCVEGISQFW